MLWEVPNAPGLRVWYFGQVLRRVQRAPTDPMRASPWEALQARPPGRTRRQTGGAVGRLTVSLPPHALCCTRLLPSGLDCVTARLSCFQPRRGNKSHSAIGLVTWCTPQ